MPKLNGLGLVLIQTNTDFLSSTQYKLMWFVFVYYFREQMHLDDGFSFAPEHILGKMRGEIFHVLVLMQRPSSVASPCIINR